MSISRKTRAKEVPPCEKTPNELPEITDGWMEDVKMDFTSKPASRRPILVALTLGLALAGLNACRGSIVTAPTPEEISRVRVGVSTAANVLDALGLPNRIERRGETQTWTYFSGPDARAVRDLFGTGWYPAGSDADRKDLAVKVVFAGPVVTAVKVAP